MAAGIGNTRSSGSGCYIYICSEDGSKNYFSSFSLRSVDWFTSRIGYKINLRCT